MSEQTRDDEWRDKQIHLSDYKDLKARADEWREEAWRCYVASGADPNGADARHLNIGEAVAAVKEARQNAEEGEDELLARLLAAEESLRLADEMAKGIEDAVPFPAQREALDAYYLSRKGNVE